jgi:pre-mRNA-processing factor 17
VLFAEDGTRFVSTSDDKKILIWEYGIPVPMKYISDPTMHTIPTTALHPSTQHFTAQSMENEIHVYGARQKFRRIRKKVCGSVFFFLSICIVFHLVFCLCIFTIELTHQVFKGHMGAGFACQMSFSPNGKYFASGDGEGRLFVWDWKSTKQLRRFRCHDDGPCIDCQWHPLEPSWVATCGWDGVIKLWD